MPDGLTAAQRAAGPDCGKTLEDLRAQGAHRFDPVGFHYLETLLGRLTARPGAFGLEVSDRLHAALTRFSQRFAAAQGEARAIADDAASRFPERSDDLHRLCASGEFGQLRRAIALLEGGAKADPLSELLRYIAAQSGEAESGVASEHSLSPASGGTVPNAGAGDELKSLRYFRQTWSTLSVDRQLAQALAEGPENAGPLNSHRLVLQALKRLNALSPDYLKRFMCYVDTVLRLDQAGIEASVARSPRVADSDKKTKSAKVKRRQI